jgi:IMP dehydrogenase
VGISFGILKKIIHSQKNSFPQPHHYAGIGLTYDDVLLIPKLNRQGSRKEVDISQIDRSGKLKLAIPILSANMDTITGANMANFMGSHGGMGVMHRLMDVARNVKEFGECTHPTFVSIGCGDKGFNRASALYEKGARFINLDIAHGHSVEMGPTLRRLKDTFKDICLMAGNVATYDGTKYLVDHGADLVKVGIGGGSVCSTRIKTGFGVSNLTAIAECAKVGCSIVADGGIRVPGDIVKALAFGADFVMVGSLFAGTTPTPGNVTEVEGRKFKTFRGVDSAHAQIEWFGEVPKWRTPEGVSTAVPFRNDEDSILADLIGGLRSGLTYCGVDDIRGLQQDFEYRLVSSNSVRENHPHRLEGMS